MGKISALVADDDPAIRKMFCDLVGDKVDLEVASNGEEAIKKINSKVYEAIFLDIRMPGKDGMELLDEIKQISPESEVVMITGINSIETAVRAIKKGASDYLVKPFKLAQIMMTIEKLQRIRDLKDENLRLKREVQKRFQIDNMIGTTPGIRKVVQIVERIKDEDCSVLIMGESGTGKELVARAIHYQGKRKEGPFIPIDCASIHKNLLESELFGHEKGAFTGAYSRKIGLFEKGQGGTVFLDEVAEIPLELQPTLLRSIEERKIRPIGSPTQIPIDVRLITTTNRDLDSMVTQGRFRKDLFYRLNVVTIYLPPLKERTDDIPLLVDHFIKTYSGKGRRKMTGIEPQALEILQRYNWPGNIRELEHLVEKASLLGRGPLLGVADIPRSIMEAIDSDPCQVKLRPLKELEYETLIKTLRECEGDTHQAAKILRIDRSTIYRKIKRYKINLGKLRG